MKFLIHIRFAFTWAFLIGVNIHSVSTGQEQKESGRLQGATAVSHVAESLNLSLDYCGLRASLLNLTTTSRHCIKVWDYRYNKYCVKASQHFNRQRCKQLWRKLSQLRTVWNKVRLKSNEVRNKRKIRCGKVRINHRQFGCCDGTSFELETQGCCGHWIYNTTTQDCCSDVIYERESQGCCYDTVFSLMTEACCNMDIHHVGGRQDRLCCGNESIDASFYFCLNGTVLMRESFRKVNREPTSAIVPTTQIRSSSHGIITIIVMTVSLLVVIVAVMAASFIIRAEIRKFVREIVNSARCTMVGSSKYQVSSPARDSELSPESTENNEDSVDVQEDTVDTTINPPERELLNDEPYNTYEHVPIRIVSQYCVNDDISMRDMEEMLRNPEFAVPDHMESRPSINEMVTSVTTGTQTCEEKQYNIMNSLGKPFDVKHVFNANNKTLSIPNSAVTLTLSEKDTLDEKVCLASTFRNLYEITDKLKLGENSRVASPAVEYHFVNTTLQGHAKVTMPFVGDFANLTVLKIKSDQGMDVPLQSKVIKHRDDVTRGVDDEYYEIIGSGDIAIFVRSLSILTCLSPCDEKHYFTLTGYLYGKLIETPGIMRAPLRFYIADEIRSIQDYKKLIDDAEKNCGRVMLLWRQLSLPFQVNMQESIRLKLTITSPAWGHMTDRGEVIQPQEQDIPIQKITRCHRVQQSGLPFAKEWYVISDAVGPSQAACHLECILITAHVSTSGGESERDMHSIDTTLLYDDLKRQKAADPGKKVVGRAFSNEVEVVPPAGHIRQPESAPEFGANAVQHTQQDSGVPEEVVLGVGEINREGPRYVRVLNPRRSNALRENERANEAAQIGNEADEMRITDLSNRGRAQRPRSEESQRDLVRAELRSSLPENSTPTFP